MGEIQIAVRGEEGGEPKGTIGLTTPRHGVHLSPMSPLIIDELPVNCMPRRPREGFHNQGAARLSSKQADFNLSLVPSRRLGVGVRKLATAMRIRETDAP